MYVCRYAFRGGLSEGGGRVVCGRLMGRWVGGLEKSGHGGWRPGEV